MISNDPSRFGAIFLWYSVCRFLESSHTLSPFWNGVSLLLLCSIILIRANSCAARASSLFFLVLGSPVQSGFLARTPLDRDRDQLTSFHKPRETWPVRYWPVQSGLTRFFPVTRPVSTSYGPDWSGTGRDRSFVYVYIEYFISTYITYYSISKKRHTSGSRHVMRLC